MIEVNENAEQILANEQKPRFDPLRLSKLDGFSEVDVSSVVDDDIKKLVDTHTGKVGRPKKPAQPFDMVEQQEDGSIVVVKQRGQPKKEMQLLKKGLVAEETLKKIAETYYHNPDWKTVAVLTGHTAEFLMTFARTLKFHELLVQCRADLDRKEEASETGIIGKALEEIHDRVIHGDDILDSKTGQVVKVKMKGKELASVVKTMHNIRQTTRGEANSRTESVAPTDKLNKIAEQFARFSAAREINPKEDY